MNLQLRIDCPVTCPEQPLRPAAVRRAHPLRLQAPGPLHQAVRGPHHLPRRPGRRRLGRRRHGPASGARVHRPGPRHHPVHQLPGWLVHRHDRDLRHHAVHPAGDPDRLPGQAASAAAVLLAAGTPGKRLALPNARVLIHQPHCPADRAGRPPTWRSRPQKSCGCAAWLEDTLAKHSGRTPEQVNNDIERDKILTAAEAMNYGLIDQVLDSRKIKPQAIAQVAVPLATPRIPTPVRLTTNRPRRRRHST